MIRRNIILIALYTTYLDNKSLRKLLIMSVQQQVYETEKPITFIIGYNKK